MPVSAVSMVVLGALLSLPAEARSPLPPSPPSLEEVLTKAGWTMTPERTATYSPGDIYSRTKNAPVVFKQDCFDAEPREGTYTSLEVVSAMKAGARVPLGIARVRANGMQYKQLKFADPYLRELADMHLIPTTKCQNYLAGVPDIDDLFIIKAVLSAEIKEQLCRTLEGSAGIAGLGAEASLNQECTQASEGHVVVAYRTESARSLLSMTPSDATPAAGSPSTPAAAAANSSFSQSAVELSVEEKLKHQRCEASAQESGIRQREARVEAAVADSEARANQAWTAISPQLEQCTRLDPSQRVQCVSALEGWLNEARSISVTIPESVEIVQTDCGEFRPAFEAAEHTFEARSVPEAEQLLRRLNFTEETAASTVSTGTFNIMFLSHPDSGPEIDTMHVMCQHGGLVKSGPVARIENAGAGPCRVDGFIGTRQLSAVVVVDRPGTYHCFPAGTLSCAYAHP